MRRVAFVSAVLLVGLMGPVSAWAADFWVLWEIQDALTDSRRIAKAQALYEGRVACIDAAAVRAKKWHSGIGSGFNPTPVVQSENPPGSQFEANFVRHQVVCWPVGVNP